MFSVLYLLPVTRSLFNQVGSGIPPKYIGSFSGNIASTLMYIASRLQLWVLLNSSKDNTDISTVHTVHYVHIGTGGVWWVCNN